MTGKLIIQRILILLMIVPILQCGSLPFFSRGSSDTRMLLQENKKLSGEVAILNQRIARLEKEMTFLSKKSFSLLLTGDILLANGANDAMKKQGTDYPFHQIASFMEEYDLVFANLETPITTNHDPAGNKPYVFRLNPLFAASLTDIKLDIVSIANNHIMDHGTEGMLDTILCLSDMGIKYTGAGRNLDEARRPAIFHFGSMDLCILAYCERPPEDFYAGPEKPGTAPLVLEQVKEDIKQYKDGNTIVLVSLHWGIELTNYPRAYQRNLAWKIIDAGADGIIGHHPHWPQGIEMYKKKPVIYSLGNFVNGFYNKEENEKDNIFVSLRYDRERLVKIEVIPVAGKNQTIHFQPRILEGPEAVTHLKAIQIQSRGLGTRVYIYRDRGFIKP
ncbi:MAG: capsular biosynthesis protein [Spirochaetae bacterium HGW-Spirochaetae-1]|nr:MAG: capsular biosynthesis protein [Spirochaetae bacterium HGW-Spirochaetae-1]